MKQGQAGRQAVLIVLRIRDTVTQLLSRVLPI